MSQRIAIVLLMAPLLVFAAQLKGNTWLSHARTTSLLFCFSSFCYPHPAISKITDTVALERFDRAYENLVDLDSSWSMIKDGDSIRRRLGTVYTKKSCEENALCSFSSFTEKFVQKNYDDFDSDAFEAISSQYLEALNQADFLAYSSIFSEYGNGGGGADYILQSRVQVQRAAKFIKEAINFLQQ